MSKCMSFEKGFQNELQFNHPVSFEILKIFLNSFFTTQSTTLYNTLYEGGDTFFSLLNIVARKSSVDQECEVKKLDTNSQFEQAYYQICCLNI